MGGQVRPELVQRSFALGEGGGGAAALPQPPEVDEVEVDGATVFQPLPEVSGEEALAAARQDLHFLGISSKPLDL